MIARPLEPKRAHLTGPLSQASVVQVLRAVFVRGLSGRVLFTRGDESIGLRFISGHVVSGSSEPVLGRLGEVLVRSGVLERAQLDPALDLAARRGRRLGPVLVEQQLATREQVEEALRLQVYSVLSDALSWGRGSFRFEPNDGSLPPLEEVSLRISTTQLILKAVNSIEDPSSVREALGDPNRLVSSVKHPPVRLEELTLSPGDAFVLSRADGDLTARELLEITPLPPETVERSLLALLALGVVEYRSLHSRRSSPGPVPTSQTVARPQEAVGEAIPVRPVAEEKQGRFQEIHAVFVGLGHKSHRDVLGVGPGASADEVRKAYQRLATRFHPDALGDAPPEEAAKAKAIFMRVSEAYCALRSALPRISQDPRPVAARPLQNPAPAPPPAPIVVPQPAPELAPDESLRMAEEAFAERPWEALGILERLIPRSTGTIRSRARLLRARALLKSPGSLRTAELELREIVEENPTYANAWLALGSFYKERGLAARAASMFRKVLEVQPGNRRATTELRAVCGTEGAFPRSSELRVAGV
jgi:tetratricopeptide (TPR) repeat protein